uniref:Uncharacterized protein n=1 Tax=Corvus moneduloides TaxID=1196302 RepID=A0A8C3GTN0_CORMO
EKLRAVMFLFSLARSLQHPFLAFGSFTVKVVLCYISCFGAQQVVLPLTLMLSLGLQAPLVTDGSGV